MAKKIVDTEVLAEVIEAMRPSGGPGVRVIHSFDVERALGVIGNHEREDPRVEARDERLRAKAFFWPAKPDLPSLISGFSNGTVGVHYIEYVTAMARENLLLEYAEEVRKVAYALVDEANARVEKAHADELKAWAEEKKERDRADKAERERDAAQKDRNAAFEQARKADANNLDKNKRLDDAEHEVRRLLRIAQRKSGVASEPNFAPYDPDECPPEADVPSPEITNTRVTNHMDIYRAACRWYRAFRGEVADRPAYEQAARQDGLGKAMEVLTRRAKENAGNPDAEVALRRAWEEILGLWREAKP
jgi:hypothetical protein